MLTMYRRHAGACPFATKPRHAKGSRSCAARCPIWVQGTIGSERVRRSLDLTSWEAAAELIRGWETAGSIGPTNDAAAHEDEASPGASASGQEADAPSQSHVRFERAGHAETSSLSVALCVEAYLRDCQARNLVPAAVRKYRTILEKHLMGYCLANGIVALADLSLPRLRTFREGWTFAPITHAKNLERLRTFFRFCVASGWCATNPATALKPPKQRHQPTLPFDDAECQRLLAAIDDWRFGSGRWDENGRRVRALFLVLRHTGLRICDALRLARTQVVDGRVFLYQAKTGLPVYIPVPAEVTDALGALKRAGPYYFWRGHHHPSERQAEYAYQVWRRKLLVLAVRANVPNARFHRFRDSFAVGLLSKGVALEIVSMLLGHASVKVTEKHYKPWVKQLQLQLESAVRSTWS